MTEDTKRILRDLQERLRSMFPKYSPLRHLFVECQEDMPDGYGGFDLELFCPRGQPVRCEGVVTVARGQYLLDKVGEIEEIVVPGIVRRGAFYGDLRALPDFEDLAGDLGRLLPGLSSLETTGRQRFPDMAVSYWLWYVHALAWRNQPGTLLQAKRRRWTKWCQFNREWEYETWDDPRPLELVRDEESRDEPFFDDGVVDDDSGAEPPDDVVLASEMERYISPCSAYHADYFLSLLPQDVFRASSYALQMILNDSALLDRVEMGLPAPVALPSGQTWHSKDFRKVKWGTYEFEFNKSQADCIALLWKASDSGEAVSNEVFMKALKSKAKRENWSLGKVFRTKEKGQEEPTPHEAWEVMIEVDQRGQHRLAPRPDATQLE